MTNKPRGSGIAGQRLYTVTYRWGVRITFVPMSELYFKKLEEKITLTDADKDVFRKYLRHKKIRKKQYLLQEGQVCTHTAFVEKGALRLYTVDEKGAEHILQFAIEGWFVSDLYSMITGEPSVYNIEALEDSELVLISKTANDELMNLVPKFQCFGYMQMQAAYVALQRRITDMISLNSEEKYAKLQKTYPEIIQRVPQHMIASYLGLTPETLSRARRNLIKP